MKAYVWMSGTLVCYTVVAIATRELTFNYDVPTILFYRSIVAILLSTLLVGISREGFSQLRTSKFHLHILRNFVHFFGQFGWFFAIASIPLAHVFAIEFTVPIWIALLSPIFLNEKLTTARIISVLIGFAGVLIIVRPFGLNVELGSVVMLMGALGFAGAMLVTRHLIKTDSPLCILFFMAIVQFPITTALFLGFGTPVVPDLLSIGLITLVTAGVMTAHYCMSRAFLLAEIIAVVPMEYLRLPMIAVIGAILYAEPIDAVTVIGGCAILLSNYMNIRSATR